MQDDEDDEYDAQNDERDGAIEVNEQTMNVNARAMAVALMTRHERDHAMFDAVGAAVQSACIIL